MSHYLDTDDLIADGDDTLHHGKRGRDWRRSQRANHGDRRRTKGDTGITRVVRDKRNALPLRLVRERDHLASLVEDV